MRLEVFNILGQRVAALVDAEQEAGWHEVVFERAEIARQTAGGLASGVYVYRFAAGDFVETGKLLLLSDLTLYEVVDRRDTRLQSTNRR